MYVNNGKKSARTVFSNLSRCYILIKARFNGKKAEWAPMKLA